MDNVSKSFPSYHEKNAITLHERYDALAVMSFHYDHLFLRCHFLKIIS